MIYYKSFYVVDESLIPAAIQKAINALKYELGTGFTYSVNEITDAPDFGSAAKRGIVKALPINEKESNEKE
jgi:hypothetical protein